MHDRAYALLEVKSFDADARTIEGIASTPAPDRKNDVMDPIGAQFTLPMPLLWQHNQVQPVGEVTEARVTPEGILIRAKFAQVLDPGPLKARLDDAWQHVKAGLVRGLSIGWQPITAVPRKGGGFHVTKWHWAELSLVTIALNQPPPFSRSNRPAWPPPVRRYGPAPRRASQGGATMRKTFTEQRAEYEGARDERPACSI